ncbi:hypothetical protein AB0F88_14825 [Streptosporangium sp. NPDC023963]|uniref:hypothetical protein n=1 Tax=Streptosporangium sp. NPDC023963 TaxID=3155608 RepID=UPI003426F4B0
MSEETAERETPEQDLPPAGPRGADGESRVVAERSGSDTAFPERPLLADPDDARRTPEEESPEGASQAEAVADDGADDGADGAGVDGADGAGVDGADGAGVDGADGAGVGAEDDDGGEDGTEESEGDRKGASGNGTPEPEVGPAS